jgi:hypothetical protein
MQYKYMSKAYRDPLPVRTTVPPPGGYMAPHRRLQQTLRVSLLLRGVLLTAELLDQRRHLAPDEIR